MGRGAAGMAARIHDGDDITEPFCGCCAAPGGGARPHSKGQGDIRALVIRRRKRETMRGDDAAPETGRLRAAVYTIGLSATMGDRAGDYTAQTVAVQGMKISGARKVETP